MLPNGLKAKRMLSEHLLFDNSTPRRSLSSRSMAFLIQTMHLLESLDLRCRLYLPFVALRVEPDPSHRARHEAESVDTLRFE
jgi:ABC-type lipoprotein export system ATPase subunit